MKRPLDPPKMLKCFLGVWLIDWDFPVSAGWDTRGEEEKGAFALMVCSEVTVHLRTSSLGGSTPFRSSEHVHDEVVDLCEHHEVNGQTGAPVLGRRVAGQPGEGVVLLQNKSLQEVGEERERQTPLDKEPWSNRRFIPEHIRGVVRVQRMGVFAVKKLVWLDWRHVQVQGGLRKQRRHSTVVLAHLSECFLKTLRSLCTKTDQSTEIIEQ